MKNQRLTKKTLDFSARLLSAVSELLTDEENQFHIDYDELKDEGGAESFLLALSTFVPTYLHNKWTGKQLTHLEFNHLMNGLIMNYAEEECLEEKEKELKDKTNNKSQS